MYLFSLLKDSTYYSFSFCWVEQLQQDFTLLAKYQYYQKGEVLLHQWQTSLYQSGLTSRRNPWLNYTTCFLNAITTREKLRAVEQTNLVSLHWSWREAILWSNTVHDWWKITLKELLVAGFCQKKRLINSYSYHCRVKKALHHRSFSSYC